MTNTYFTWLLFNNIQMTSVIHGWQATHVFWLQHGRNTKLLFWVRGLAQKSLSDALQWPIQKRKKTPNLCGEPSSYFLLNGRLIVERIILAQLSETCKYALDSSPFRTKLVVRRKLTILLLRVIPVTSTWAFYQNKKYEIRIKTDDTHAL